MLSNLGLILISSVVSAAPLTVTETRITTSGLAHNPAIYGDRIAYVFISDTEPDFWVDVYDLSTKSVIASSDYDNVQKLPDIYGDRVVFDSANGISVYDLSTKETQYIPYGGHYPKIYGDRIVWSDSNIYMYNLSTKKETQITTNESVTDHAIYGNRIVWMNYDTQERLPFTETDIYMYDLSTLEKTEILFYSSASNLEIYENKILWVNHHEMSEPGWSQNDDITVYDLSTNSFASISTKGSTGNPDIYMDNVVWQDDRDGNSNIYMYDLSSNTETQITTSGSAYNPQIYGNRIVWQDSRNGGYDIYMATLGYATYPAADFSSNVTTGTAPLKVAFTDKSTGSPTSWNWNFGDGTANSTVQNPTHTYSAAGNYTVALTATNTAGSNTTAKSKYITVTGATIQKPVINCWGSPRTGAAPLTVYFKDNSTGSPTSWNWSFGDGTANSTIKNPVHVYSAAGNYTIKLTVTNAAGSTSVTKSNYITVTGTSATKPVANFSSNVTSGKAPLNVLFSDKSTGTPTSWNWNFGDGTANSTVKNPVHTYSTAGNYTVSLTATNTAGSSTATKSKYITVSSTTPPALIANLSSNVTTGTAPLNVAFTDRSTGSPAAWNWSFGDGTYSTTKNPVHLYSKIGNYTVKLTVKNATGSTNSITKMNYIKVKTPATTTAPVVYFWASRTSGTVPITIGFTDASTNTPTSWKWNFGDGTYSTVQNPKHIYSKAGTYSITLTASNAAGSATKTRYSYIKLT